MAHEQHAVQFEDGQVVIDVGERGVHITITKAGENPQLFVASADTLLEPGGRIWFGTAAEHTEALR